MKTLFAVLVVFVLLLPGLLPNLARGVREWPVDGLEGLRGGLFLEDTVFAPGYSVQAFSKVRVGMTREQVYELVGPPLDSWGSWGDAGNGYEQWSHSPGDHSYRRRVIEYTDDLVAEIDTEFWHD
jgi:hypothetical protein